MAIDDSTNYTLTGAQVKDLAARIKAGGGGMTVYVDASFATPSSITGVFLNKALTVPADPAVMFDTILAGNIVVVIFDGGQAQELIELSSVNSNSRSPEVGYAFTSAISTNAVFSAPTVVTLIYDDTLDSWSVETTAVSAVNNGTLTIQHNGTDVQTFTANQSTNATANIETIWADDITPTTPVAPITTDQIQDGAVTSAKINWGTTVQEVSVSDFITMESGFTMPDNETHIYTVGKLVIAHLIINSTNNFTTTQTTVGTIKTAYRPAHQINTYGALGSSQWDISGSTCYAYIVGGDVPAAEGPGVIIIADRQNTGKKSVKLTLTWVTA